MSSYKKLTKHPETKQFELATWIDNYFGEHNSGIIFDSSPNVIHDSRDEEFETKEDTAQEINIDFWSKSRQETNNEQSTYYEIVSTIHSITRKSVLKELQAIIKTHIEANTENNMISLEARLAVNKELNELLEEIK